MSAPTVDYETTPHSQSSSSSSRSHLPRFSRLRLSSAVSCETYLFLFLIGRKIIAIISRDSATITTIKIICGQLVVVGSGSPPLLLLPFVGGCVGRVVTIKPDGRTAFGASYAFGGKCPHVRGTNPMRVCVCGVCVDISNSVARITK